MRNQFESAETFAACAVIDAGYYYLRLLQIEISKPVSPIERAVDRACGVTESRIDDVIEILQDIIKAKKFMEDDYSRDEQFLNKTLKLKSEIKLRAV